MQRTLTSADGTEVPLLRVKPPARVIVGNACYYVAGTLLSLLFLFPLLYMLATSTKSESVFAQDAGTIRMFLPDFAHIGTMFENYKKVLTEYEIWKYALNSLLYAAIVIVLNIIVNGLAGYVMAKMNFPGKRLFAFMIIFLIVVPVETSIIPLYLVVKTMLGLKGTLSVFGIIFPATISVFNIFLFIQFFQGIPKEYEEAARIDGASTLDIFFRVILPLSKPIVATVAVFCFIGVERLSLAVHDPAEYNHRLAAPADSGGADDHSEHRGHHDGRGHGVAGGDQYSDLCRVCRGTEIHCAGLRFCRP